MKKHTIIAVLAAALLAPAVRAADVTEADYEKAMKDVLAGMQGAGKALRDGGADLTLWSRAARPLMPRSRASTRSGSPARMPRPPR